MRQTRCMDIRHSIRYPADTRWQVPAHHYYITFWTQEAAPAGVDQDVVGWTADMNEIPGAADVVEVVQWAESEALQRNALYTIFARMEFGESGPGPGLVWLAGHDPTVNPKWNFELPRPSDVTPMAGGTQPYRPSHHWPDA